MCKDKLIKTQSYFWSANEQALAWLKRVKKKRKLNLSVHSQATLSSRKISWSNVQLISRCSHSLRSFSSRSAATLWVIFLLYLASLSILLIQTRRTEIRSCHSDRWWIVDWESQEASEHDTHSKVLIYQSYQMQMSHRWNEDVFYAYDWSAVW